MNLIKLVWSYLKAKPLNTGLNIFLLALGIAVIDVLLLFNNQLQEKISANAKGIDLVVGAKGSPLQLILCSVFQIDFPTGNIKVREAEKVARHRMVKSVIPLALGDSYNGYRIVGTTSQYAALYNGTPASGDWWKKDLEVTLGATVAQLSKLKIGDKFASAHGLTTDGHDHDENKYVVVGILGKTNTVLDNLILTNVESVWKVHQEHPDTVKRTVPLRPSSVVPSVENSDSVREITSLLVQYRNPLAAIQLPRFVNTNSTMQAASPAFETARLFSILGVGVEVLRGFAYVLILISGLSIFIALYNSLRERQYDMAIMRSMGASRAKLFVSMVMEGSFLTLLGSVFGLVIGHAVLWSFTQVVVESEKAGVTASVFYVEEAYILLGSVMLGIFCSIIPAIQAYRTDIHKVLAGN
jgi:putative ABC transport system permease protein